ncbi:SDR family NAD(P)-dependent oxidoreductase [Aliiglaciecola litoralis]|uniref:Glucose 1-dehydrogenase n=1 Tax=Aliiglaciecola litoralis TaxID=582857 RepID=A0ABN1LLC4_9ALTE
MLNDKIILITGASSGIGYATALECAKQGAFVYIAGRNSEALQELHLQIEKSSVLAYDITDEVAVKQAFSQIMQNSGKLDGLVNCAGVMLDAGFAMTRLSDLQHQLNTNTVAAYQHAQLATRLMTKQRCGSIVNLCSAVGEQGSVGQSAYATSKAALSGLTKSLSKELGSLGIRVNAVAPGFIDTAMTSSYQGESRQQIVTNSALGRAGQAQEVAHVICFLLSQQASFISGQIIAVDGGLSL